MRKYNWQRKEFANTIDMLEFINSYNFTSEDFKIFSFQGFIQLVYNKAVIEEMECS